MKKTWSYSTSARSTSTASYASPVVYAPLLKHGLTRFLLLKDSWDSGGRAGEEAENIGNLGVMEPPR